MTIVFLKVLTDKTIIVAQIHYSPVREKKTLEKMEKDSWEIDANSLHSKCTMPFILDNHHLVKEASTFLAFWEGIFVYPLKYPFCFLNCQQFLFLFFEILMYLRKSTCIVVRDT